MSAPSPLLLWRWYVDHLVHYAPDSWVASAVSTFRILALLTVLPTVLLMLLDVTSYVIARTLGDTSAFTSDTSKHRAPAPPPPRIVVQPADPAVYAAADDENEGAARLAGVGVFSPASSRPPSPTVVRRGLPREEPVLEGEGRVLEGEEHVQEDGELPEGAREDGAVPGSSTNGSTSGEESFAMLERSESFEDADAGVLRMRKRVRGEGAQEP